MSRDNWGRLVEAVLRNEELREIARAPSMDPSDDSSRLSFSSISSDLNSRFSFSSPPQEHEPVSRHQAVNKRRSVHFTASSFLEWIPILPRRRPSKQKEKFFKQNGGLLLLQKLSEGHLANEEFRIFTSEDLSRAINNYKGNLISYGGFRTVHKGILPDNREIAIKKTRIIDRIQIDQFISVVIDIFKINHQNVVKLLGCCLETEVPLLVYDFITNGTLFSHIHDPILASNFSWQMRMKVAAETAAALAYLHTIPVIHGDIKSANVLLDQSYTAKVTDLESSRFDTLDDSVFNSLVQGTIGYLDLEYLLSGQLTEKSDVYSFGVVLAELLTAQKAISHDRPEEDRILSSYFLDAIRDDRLVQIVDKNLVREDRIEQVKRFAKLTERCLKSKREERPSMKEVAMELEALRSVENHQLRDEYLNHKETTEPLI